MITSKLNMSPAHLVMTLLALASASVSPLAFTVSATGVISMHALGLYAILPALVVWIALMAISAAAGYLRLLKAGFLALATGFFATLAMEIVRIIGFRFFAAMPGSLPMLIGVQLSDQFMDGPDAWSNFIGWGDHLWNGIGFAFIYIVVLGRAHWWVGVLYGIMIATVFMISPVMSIIGAGPFGQDFSPIKFPVTVYLAHMAYGLTLGGLVYRSVQWAPDSSLLGRLFSEGP